LLPSKKKLWLGLSVFFNLGLLGFFKYYNFFIDSWISMLSVLGYGVKSAWTLKIVLPVGISFYTFQTMSYSFDVYHKNIKATKSFLSFAAFVSFFPQLVAGPIERASNLLSQIATKRIFSYKQSVEGLKLILWGLFKKMVIADALAPIVDDVFANYSSYPAPLGGSRRTKWISIRNISIVFLISGLWHGANWTFLCWGALHAVAFIPVFLSGHHATYKNSIIGEHALFPSFKELLSVLMVFILVTLSWVFFRSETITDAFNYILRIFVEFSFETYMHPKGYRMVDYFLLLGGFVIYEYMIRKDERSPFKFKSGVVRFIVYTIVILVILLFYDSGVDRSFIYFQF